MDHQESKNFTDVSNVFLIFVAVVAFFHFMNIRTDLDGWLG